MLNKKCIPCEGGLLPLPEDKINEFMQQIHGWQLIEEKIQRIKKQFTFKNFKEAMKFVNKVADLAEKEGHHPNIFIYYNKVELELYTHAIKGLHENDFILAAKIDAYCSVK